MVFFNYALRKLNAKIVYYGPGLCGKTTNLQWIHDHFEGGHTGKMVSLATEGDRTIFFDLLPLDIGSVRGMGVTLQLYTVPGQVHYNATRQLVLRGADGVVFVADSQVAMRESNRESWQNLKENLRLQGLDLESFPHVLQFNKRDLREVLPMDELDADLNEFHAPLFEAVAVKGIGVQETLEGIVRLVMRSLRDRYEPDAPARREPAPAPAPRPTVPTAPTPPVASVSVGPWDAPSRPPEGGTPTPLAEPPDPEGAITRPSLDTDPGVGTDEPEEAPLETYAEPEPTPDPNDDLFGTTTVEILHDASHEMLGDAEEEDAASRTSPPPAPSAPPPAAEDEREPAAAAPTTVPDEREPLGAPEPPAPTAAGPGPSAATSAPSLRLPRTDSVEDRVAALFGELGRSRSVARAAAPPASAPGAPSPADPAAARRESAPPADAPAAASVRADEPASGRDLSPFDTGAAPFDDPAADEPASEASGPFAAGAAPFDEPAAADAWPAAPAASFAEVAAPFDEPPGAEAPEPERAAVPPAADTASPFDPGHDGDDASPTGGPSPPGELPEGPEPPLSAGDESSPVQEAELRSAPPERPPSRPAAVEGNDVFGAEDPFAEPAVATAELLPRRADLVARPEGNQLRVHLEGTGALAQSGQVRELDIVVPVPGGLIGNQRVTLQLRLTLTPVGEETE